MESSFKVKAELLNELPRSDLPIWKVDSAQELLKSFKVRFSESESTSSCSCSSEEERKSAPLKLNLKGKVSVRQLLSVLRSNPEFMRRIPAILKSRNLISDEASAKLIYALRVIDTPEAQRILVSIATDLTQSHVNILRAVIAMGGLKNPTDATIASLWELVEERGNEDQDDISNTALLSIGIIGRTLREKKDPRYPRLRSEICRSLENAEAQGDNDFLIAGIKAVGNTRDLYFANLIIRLMKSEDSGVRGACAYALTNLKSQKSTELLLNILEGEKSSYVRLRAVEGLSIRKPSRKIVSAFEKAALREKNPIVRYKIVKYLAESVKDFPRVRSFLKELVKSSIDRKTAQLIYHVLGKWDASHKAR